MSLEFSVIAAAAGLPILVFLVWAVSALFSSSSLRPVTLSPDGEQTEGNEGYPYETPNSEAEESPQNGVDVSFIRPVDIAGILIFVFVFGSSLLSLLKKSTEEKPLDFNTVVGSGVLQLILMGTVIAIITFRVSPIRFFGLNKSKFGKIIGSAALGYVSMIGAALLLEQLRYKQLLDKLFGELKQQEAVDLLQRSNDTALLASMAIMACIVAPVAEEVIFRGYIYPTMKRFTNIKFASIASSLFFAAIHVNVQSLAPLFILALILVYVYERTSSLWTPILLHMAFNSSTVLIQLAMRMNPELVPTAP